ncbi:unnamed protein product, partial [Effrenium voratum]
MFFLRMVSRLFADVRSPNSSYRWQRHQFELTLRARSQGFYPGQESIFWTGVQGRDTEAAMALVDGASTLKGNVVGKFHANAEETFLIVIHNTSIEVCPWPGLREPRSQSQPPAARWTLPWDAPSPFALERHRSGRCDPCLFFTRKADGC